jgi:hypothetical protein
MAAPARAPGPYLTTEEFAALMHTTPGNVHVMRSRGKAPKAIKRGNRLLFPLPVVEAWVRSQLA